MNRLGILLALLALLGLVARCGSDGDTSPTPTSPTPDAAAVTKLMSPAQLALGDPVTNSVGIVLVPIPAGEFMMGQDTKRPVKISEPFHLGVFEVTQEQYEKVMGEDPSRFSGLNNNPVEKVNWEDAVEFCRKLSALPAEKAAGRVYRLPTESEWEYACRAGTTTDYSFGDDPTKLGEYAWYHENAARKTHPVGEKKPNAWALYDMHGNVWEWCQDKGEGSSRVFRGGGWYYSAKYCRSSIRRMYFPSLRVSYLGFRVASVPSSQPTEKPESGAV